MNENKKVVVITGSTRGIGFGLAENLLDLGCLLTISGRSKESTDEALARLMERYPDGSVFGQPCDVCRPEQIQALWDAAMEQFGRIDIWINNAGQPGRLMDFHQLSNQEIATVVDTNITGALYGTRIAIIGMLQQGFGAIYNMEGHGSNGRKQAGLTLYGTSKAALRYFDDCLFEELEGTPLIAGALMPGMVWTDFVSGQFEDRPEELERNKGILNIIMDRVETVTPWLAQKILDNDRNGVRFHWLTRRKMIARFAAAPFSKRQIIDV